MKRSLRSLSTKKLVSVIVLMAIAICLWGFRLRPSTPADRARTAVVFTQVHNHRHQTVPADVAIHIQMPGEPIAWEVDRDRTNVPVEGPTIIPSPRRIPDVADIYQFELILNRGESADIHLKPIPLGNPNPLFQPFELKLTATDVEG